MSFQIFGVAKCKDTQKAIRFFKERRIDVQFIDLKRKGVSPGELRSIARTIPLDDLIDRDGKEYEKRNLQYLRHNVEEVLLEYPLLFRTPIIRSGGRAAIGYDPDELKAWIK